MDRNSILKNRTSHPIFKILDKAENFDKVELMKFYNNLETLLKRDVPYAKVGEKLKICLIVDPEETKGRWNLFDKDVFISKLSKDDFLTSNVLIVCCNGDVIRLVKKQVKNPIEAEELSLAQKDQVIIFVDCRKLDFFVNGRWIHHIEDIIDSLHSGQRNKESLPAREYRKLIENHYKKKVDGERGFKYWKPKRKRILFDRPEVIFHKPLYSYLDDYTLDAKVDSEISLRGTSDRTDIRILSFDTREIYIIEIKCLGKSVSRQRERSDGWANKGILQLKVYLGEEPDSKVGLLVVYDGRKENQNIGWIAKEHWHDKTDPNPMRFYLISQPASKRASVEYAKVRPR